MNISSPWSVYTQTFALSAGCLFLPLYCVPGRLASGLSSGPEASGSRRVGGEAGGCMCQGTSFRGPTVAWLSFHVCLQKHSSSEGGRKRKMAALPLLFSHVSSASRPGWWERVNIKLLITSLFYTLKAITNAECTQYDQQICFPFTPFFIIYQQQDYFRGCRGRQNA